MKKLFVVAALTLMGMSAHAGSFAWYCGLDIKGHAEGFQVLYGKYEMKGVGTIKCYNDFFQDTYIQPVSVDLSTPPLALNVGLSSFDFVGGAAHITFIAESPEVMFGKYLLANANAAVFYGAGIYSATRVDTPSISMQLELNVQQGFGIQAGFTIMNMQPLAPMEPEVPEFRGK